MDLVLQTVLFEQLHHRRSKTAGQVCFLDRDDQTLRSCKCEQQRRVEWLNKSPVHDCGFDAILRESLSNFQRWMDHRAVSNNRYFATIAQYFAFTDFEQFGFTIDRSADAVAARITHRGWADMLQHREQHVAHLAFVFRRHHDDVWHWSQIGDIE